METDDKNQIKSRTIENRSEDKFSKDFHHKKSISKVETIENQEEEEESNNKSLRCLDCFSIPLLFLNHSTHSMKLKCESGHNISIDVRDYVEKGFAHNFYNQICSQCKTKIDVLTEKKNYYCKECNEIFCRTCIKNHNLIFNNNDNQNLVHHFINLEKFDTTCVLHNETYDYFCLECNKNICQYCYYSKHKMHKMIDLDDIILKRKELKRIKDNFKMEKENLNLVSQLLKKLIIKLKKEINKILEYKEAELKFKESTINIYEKKIDNYYIIKNIKNLLFNTCLIHIDKNSTYLEQLNYLYEYLNKDLTKVSQDALASKKSNSSLNSRLTKGNLSQDKSGNKLKKIIRKDKKEKQNKFNSDNSKSHSKNKVKSYDKVKHKNKIKDSGNERNNIIKHEKRSTMQLENTEILLDSHLNKLVVNKKMKNFKKATILNDIKYFKTENNINGSPNPLIKSADEYRYSNLKNNTKLSRNDLDDYNSYKIKIKKIKKNEEDKSIDKDREKETYCSTLTLSERENQNYINDNNDIKVKSFEINEREDKDILNENAKNEFDKTKAKKSKKSKKNMKKVKKIKNKFVKEENGNSKIGINNTSISTEKIKNINNNIIVNINQSHPVNISLEKSVDKNNLKDIEKEKIYERLKDRYKESEKYEEEEFEKKPKKKVEKENGNQKEALIEKDKDKEKERQKEKEKEKEKGNEREIEKSKGNDSIQKENLNPYSKKIHLIVNSNHIKDKKEIKMKPIKAKILNKVSVENIKKEELSNQNSSNSKNKPKNKDNEDITGKDKKKDMTKSLEVSNSIKKKINDMYRHKKILNKSSCKNISINFQMNRSIDDFHSYINLNESIKEDKKRKQEIYKEPSFEKRRTSLPFCTTRRLKIFSFMGQKINKDLLSEFKNEKNDKVNIKINEDKSSNNNEGKNLKTENEKNNKNSYKSIKVDENDNVNQISIKKGDNNLDSNSKNLTSLNDSTPIEDRDLFLSDGTTLNEFNKKTLKLTVKEYENTVYSLLEINPSIFAVGFLNGEIDIYDTKDIICLFSILEHNSRINNMFLLNEHNTLLSSSFDYTMKKIKIIEEKKTYVVEFVFDGYDNILYKGIELSNGQILSISFGGIINIWNKLTSKAYIRGQNNIIENEEIYDIIEINNKLIAISTDENLHFYNLNLNKNDCLSQNKVISDLDFKERNNMVLLNSNILGILLKNEIGLVDIAHRQVIHKCNIYGGKPETITMMKDNTVLVSVSNYNIKDYDEETIEKNNLNINKVMFLQYELINNGLSFLIQKEEVSDKINSKDYCRITSLIELNNGIVAFCTSGMEDGKMCGTISTFDY